jgi:hypothetical protein
VRIFFNGRLLRTGGLSAAMIVDPAHVKLDPRGVSVTEGHIININNLGHGRSLVKGCRINRASIIKPSQLSFTHSQPAG